MTAPSTSDPPAESPEPVALLWSGGKDAALTLDALQADGSYRVAALVVTVVEEADTVTMHGTPLALIRRQARAVGIPLEVMHVPPSPSNATYEARLERALAPLMADGVTTVAAGDLFLDDIRAYRDDVLQAIGATAVFPIWGEDTTHLARRFLDRGHRAVVTSVDTTQLDASFAGRAYDASLLEDLPQDVDPCGENGEFHTFVTHAPVFADPVPVRVVETHGDGRMRYARLDASEEANG